MSSGGIFSLVTADDKTDTYFTAMDYLASRITSAIASKTIPTIKFIEQTHIVYTKSKYVPYVGIASEYISAGSTTVALGNSDKYVQMTLPTMGDFINDIVLNVQINPVGSKQDYIANTEPSTTLPLYRYCAYPGIRLMKKVEFKTDSNLSIESYTPEDVIAYKNFFVSSNHKTGWSKCYGQDVVQDAVYNSKSFSGVLKYTNGYQTPKVYQDYFNMFIPISFWFCEDVSNSILVAKTASSQRSIGFTITSLDNILQSLIYVTNEGVPPNLTQVGTQQIPLPITTLGMKMTLYVNFLFTYPDILKIIQQDVNFNLVRIHKNQITALDSASGSILLSNLHYAGEYLAIGIRNKNNKRDFDRWHLMGSDFLTPDTNHSASLFVPAIVWNQDLLVRQLVTREALPSNSLNTVVDTLSLTVYGGIILYPSLPQDFYNNYLPTRYSKKSLVVSPSDNNMYLISFCLYPGYFNPSGYFNLATQRELYLNYSLKNEYSVNPYNYEIVVCMSALNFMIYSGDSISLKNKV
jgi:hypothetical protein